MGLVLLHRGRCLGEQLAGLRRVGGKLGGRLGLLSQRLLPPGQFVGLGLLPLDELRELQVVGVTAVRGLRLLRRGGSELLPFLAVDLLLSLDQRVEGVFLFLLLLLLGQEVVLELGDVFLLALALALVEHLPEQPQQIDERGQRLVLHGNRLVPLPLLHGLAGVVHQIAGPVVGHDHLGRRPLVLQVADQFLALVAGRLFEVSLGRFHPLHGRGVAGRLVGQGVAGLHVARGPEDGPLLLDEHIEELDFALALALALLQEHVLIERPDLHEKHLRGHPHGRAVFLLRVADGLVGEHVVVVERELVEVDPGRGLVAHGPLGRVGGGPILGDLRKRGLGRHGLEPGGIERDRHSLAAGNRHLEPQVVEAVGGRAADLHRNGVDLARPLVLRRLGDLEDRLEGGLGDRLGLGFRDGRSLRVGFGRPGDRRHQRVARPGQAERALHRQE